MESGPRPEESNSLINNNRNELRRTLYQSFQQMYESSSIIIIFKIIYLTLKLIAIILILSLTSTDTEEPLTTFVYILIAVDAVSIITNTWVLV